MAAFDSMQEAAQFHARAARDASRACAEIRAEIMAEPVPAGMERIVDHLLRLVEVTQALAAAADDIGGDLAQVVGDMACT